MINLTQIKLTLATAIQINYLSNVHNSELVYIFQTYKYATQTKSLHREKKSSRRLVSKQHHCFLTGRTEQAMMVMKFS